MEGYAEIFADVSKLTALLGVLALIVSVITEVVKKVEFLNKAPTGCTVVLISIVVCVGSYFGLAAYYKLAIEWYMVFASFLAAFVVALVSMNGWDYLTELAGRMMKKKG